MSTPVCPKCKVEMVHCLSKHGLFWACRNFPRCDITHGAHQDTGEPLGIPADKATRQQRSLAHKLFDRLWHGKQSIMSRHNSYLFMQKALKLTEEQAHIGMLDIEQCLSLIKAVRMLRKERKKNHGYKEHTKNKCRRHRKLGREI